MDSGERNVISLYRVKAQEPALIQCTEIKLEALYSISESYYRMHKEWDSTRPEELQRLTGL